MEISIHFLSFLLRSFLLLLRVQVRGERRGAQLQDEARGEDDGGGGHA